MILEISSSMNCRIFTIYIDLRLIMEAKMIKTLEEVILMNKIHIKSKVLKK